MRNKRQSHTIVGNQQNDKNANEDLLKQRIKRTELKYEQGRQRADSFIKRRIQNISHSNERIREKVLAIAKKLKEETEEKFIRFTHKYTWMAHKKSNILSNRKKSNTSFKECYRLTKQNKKCLIALDEERKKYLEEKVANKHNTSQSLIVTSLVILESQE